MAKAVLKNKLNEASATGFLNTIKEENKRKDCFTVLELMEKATNAKAKMWGGSIVGFGSVHLKYESGRELDWFICGFSPRKQNIVIYGLAVSTKATLLEKLGKYKTGKGCLYINSLKDIDLKILAELIKLSVDGSRKK